MSEGKTTAFLLCSIQVTLC